MCILLKPERLFNTSYRSRGRSMSPLSNFSIALASQLLKDVKAATSGSTSKSVVLPSSASRVIIQLSSSQPAALTDFNLIILEYLRCHLLK
ncbi:hypothetical protein BAE44_0008279 [Dichanthelium oligosanthes]|uniref:Uncharacterized protein n=1 Tax=Dichanthelium oligosanthes TaxID=888268 RepID=A0A1E5W035_9POAL|nr:hypothetical protein BAE44_0008279 [Dichanthelium oligosanthes]